MQFNQDGNVEEYSRGFGGDCTPGPDYEEMYIGRFTVSHLATSNFMSSHRCDPENKGPSIKIESPVLKPFQPNECSLLATVILVFIKKSSIKNIIYPFRKYDHEIISAWFLLVE